MCYNTEMAAGVENTGGAQLEEHTKIHSKSAVVDSKKQADPNTG